MTTENFENENVYQKPPHVEERSFNQDQNMLASLAQCSNDAIIAFTLDGITLYWNDGADKIYGHNSSEILGMPITKLIPEGQNNELPSLIKKMIRGEKIEHYNTKRIRKDGVVIEVSQSISPIKNDKGQMVAISSISRDMTAMNKAGKVSTDQYTHEIMQIEQAKTLEKFRRMATVIKDSNDAITFQDLEGNILAWNRGAELMYGYSEAEALKMNIVDTVPLEYQAEARDFLASLKRGELIATLETKRKTKDGKIVDVWLTNTKLTDDKGKLTGIATTERDVTERMQSLEKFRRMATVIKDSYDAITIQDLEGNILAWNRGAELMYGYSEAEALKMNIVDTVPVDYQAEAREFLASLKRGELVATLNTKRKTKDGKIVDVWLTNTKLTDDKGKLTGVATTERDVTSQKKSEKEATEQRARELDRIVELERFQKLTVGRELKMIELKKEIGEMKKHILENSAS